MRSRKSGVPGMLWDERLQIPKSLRNPTRDYVLALMCNRAFLHLDHEASKCGLVPNKAAPKLQKKGALFRIELPPQDRFVVVHTKTKAGEQPCSAAAAALRAVMSRR